MRHAGLDNNSDASLLHRECGSKVDLSPLKPRRAHVWKAQDDAHYVEPLWVAKRLFDVEHFVGAAVHDPAAGFGTIPHAAYKAGLVATAADIVDRATAGPFGAITEFDIQDFLTDNRSRLNIVTNPPYPIVEQFTLHAIDVAKHKVAIIFPIARLPAAGRWLRALRRLVGCAIRREAFLRRSSGRAWPWWR
jgi:hypothetical protein